MFLQDFFCRQFFYTAESVGVHTRVATAHMCQCNPVFAYVTKRA